MPAADEAMFLFRIANYPHIVSAFGEEAAGRAVAAVTNHLVEIVGSGGSIVPCRHDVVGIRLMLGSIPGGSLEATHCDNWMRLICETIPLVPFECGSGAIHVWLSGFWTLSQERDDISSHRWQFPYVCPGRGLPNWARQYRDDMINASRALAVLRSCGDDEKPSEFAVRPFWQSVHSASLGTTQFFEALARIPDGNGSTVSIAGYVLSLERTGFIRLLDLHMVRHVMTELERSSEIQAAVNLSALSLRGDPWWDDVRSALALKQDIAVRLFLEITETASFPSISEAVRFVDSMRKLGCRIVLDDFGTGHASIRQLFALSPDVVKIDRLFLRRAALSDRDREIFLSLARLARSAGATVVAEGVETVEQKQIALEAGADWQQGYLWGPASGGHPRSSGSATGYRRAGSLAL
ncbi:EAL domain-containing protein (plasmid) [Novosphingobium sp. BL-8A]|uniref:EAL domain-containing protein n=1 Tax=Novosphingobium sp. BL-8A TaxID=3127639 RepID=UPI0037568F57